MRLIKQSYLIRAPVGQVWRALTDPEVINKWGGGPAIMDDQEGTNFKLWGGDIHGKNIEVVPEKLLVQEWFGGDWPEASKAVFELVEVDGGSKLTLTHSGVPQAEYNSINEGWKEHYLLPLLKLLNKT